MNKRILVVEDQRDNRQIIRDMLAPTDYEITEAENGEEHSQTRGLVQCTNVMASLAPAAHHLEHQTSECAGLFQRSYFRCPWHTRNLHSKAAGDDP